MESNSMLIQVSAFSGLIGALLTQALTGLFSYISDKRKANTDLRSTFRSKQVDIAENFYFVTGEKMAIVKKNIEYWKNYNNSRSEQSLDFLNQEIVRLNTFMDKLDAENWKYNLVSLYFDVTLTNEQVIASNLKSKEQYLKVLDLREGIRHAIDVEKKDLHGLYDNAIKEMCIHYERVFTKMTEDMEIVKKSLIRQFSK